MHRISTLAAAAALIAMPAHALAQDAATPSPTVTYTVRTTGPGLTLRIPGGAVLGLAGGVMANVDGKTLAEQMKLGNPANALAGDVATAWAVSKGGSVAGPMAVDLKTDLAAANTGKADYIVDVWSDLLIADSFTFDLVHYGLVYTASARVYDGRSGKTIAKARCIVRPKKTETSPTRSELVGNNGEGLRRLIAEANVSCAEQLRTDLKLPAAPVAPASEATPTPAAEAKPAPAV